MNQSFDSFESLHSSPADKPAFDLASAPFAGFWLRVGAQVVDFIIIIPIVILSYFTPLFLYILLSFATLLYKPFMEGFLGATVGKFAVGARVINEEGAIIGLPAAVIRHVFVILGFIPTLIVGINLKQQGLTPASFDEPERLAEAMESMNTLNQVGNFFSFLWIIAVVWVAFHPMKRGLHDLIANTYVIEKKE
ncbi:MAG: RDD family protein [Opitutales bacterium]|nr:RDD family protein [Opitutales bacterium]